MRTILIAVIIILIFSASQCKKENEDCHRTITILNGSDQAVIYSTILYDPSIDSKCLLSKRAVLNPDDSYEESLNMCWEDELELRDFEFYIVDTLNFNEESFYDCDSIEYKSIILKHFILTKNELEILMQNNFTIVYP